VEHPDSHGCPERKMAGHYDAERQEGAKGKKEPQFRVDEGWKRAVAEERERLKKEQDQATRQQGPSPAGPPPKPDFRVFLAGLYTQTLMYLGEIENPVTRKTERNLPEAQYLIDTIDMLRQKTRGNLSTEEGQYLDGLLHDLRMRYVSAAERSTAQEDSSAEQGEGKS